MAIIDRAGALRRPVDLRLELGSGSTKSPDGVVGIDRRDLPEVDVVGDAIEVLRRLPTGSVAHVRSHHFLEHVDELEELLVELGRVMKSGATMEATVPHWSNPYFYSDPTHHSFFGLYTFSYLMECSIFERQVPDYGSKPPLEVTGVHLGFKAPIDGRVVRGIKSRFQDWVNRSVRRQETYEAHLTRFTSCYELTVFARRS